jgi:hypothetical protein
VKILLNNYSNHLGNVQTTVGDRLIPVAEQTNGPLTTYEADVTSAQEYFPFGMLMLGRSFNAGDYKFGFNGQEKDEEISGANK